VAATPTPLCGADAAGARAGMRRLPGGAGRIARLAARLAGILVAAGVLLAVAAPAASAHATLLFTSPAAGSAVPSAPAVITLTFNEAVTLVGTPVTLAVALGGLAGRALTGLYREHAPPVPLPSPWALRASLLGVVAGAGLAALLTGSGNLVPDVAHLSVPRLLSSGPGVITAVEVASFAVAAALLRLRRPGWAAVPCSRWSARKGCAPTR
jgi:hypothetical protein